MGNSLTKTSLNLEFRHNLRNKHCIKQANQKIIFKQL